MPKRTPIPPPLTVFSAPSADTTGCELAWGALALRLAATREGAIAIVATDGIRSVALQLPAPGVAAWVEHAERLMRPRFRVETGDALELRTPFLMVDGMPALAAARVVLPEGSTYELRLAGSADGVPLRGRSGEPALRGLLGQLRRLTAR